MTHVLDCRVDHYKVLRLHPSAPTALVQVAQELALRELAGDYSAEAATREAAIKEAGRVLTDPNLRALYDPERAKLAVSSMANYRIVREIAEGRMGTTYEAIDRVTGKQVCLKLCNNISPDDRKFLLNEACLMFDLSHFGLPAVRQVVEMEDGNLMLVMSYIVGPTIQEQVTKGGVLPVPHTAWIMHRMLQILLYLHGNRIMHGDVKPSNIILQPGVHGLAVVDFGLSQLRSKQVTKALGITPLFAAPEQLHGELCEASDLYALALTAIYMLTGSEEAVKNRLLPAKLPAPLAAFLRQLLADDPAKRYPSSTLEIDDYFLEVRTQSNLPPGVRLAPLPLV